MILQPQFVAYAIEAIPNLMTDLGIGIIKQTPHRLPQQPAAGPQDVRRYGKGNQRVEWHPSGLHDQRQTGHDAETGPTVRKDVLSVRLQNQRVIPFPSFDQIPSENGVQDSGKQNESDAVSGCSSVRPYLHF